MGADSTQSKNQQQLPSPSCGEQLGGKYMTFRLDDQEYGISILTVREIIRLIEITRVPRASPFIRGVINLRGRVIPVLDLRLRFGMERTEATDQTVIIVVHLPSAAGPITMGLLVDEVLEVKSVPEDDIDPPPEFGIGAVAKFIVGVAKINTAVVFLLDIGEALDNVLEDESISPTPTPDP